ncbi:MAG: ribose 5-phosphate isomerase B [Armatimonadota bacterium]
MKIFIGSDHAGYALKEALRDYLQQQGYEVEDLGVFSPEPADYPDIAHQLTAQVVAQPDSRGILICGTGIGMCIAANKRRGIRAAHATEPVSAQLARAHNDANVLCLGGRILGIELAKATVDAFLQTPFSGETRHARRVQKLELP